MYCERPCPTPGYLPCSRLDNHLGPCKHHPIKARDLTEEPPAPFVVSLVVWIILAIFCFLVVFAPLTCLVSQ